MYNKLFTKILDSSIWLEDDATRIVWFTLLAAMDETGFAVFASVQNLAHRARVNPENCTRAVATLEGPDKDSSDQENEGRRIERVPGGWIILNAGKYREMVSREVAREKTRLRVAKFRQERKSNGDVTVEKRFVTPSEAEAKAEAKADTNTKPEEEEQKTVAVAPEVGSEHSAFIKGWCENFKKKFGLDYRMKGPRDGQATKELLKIGILRIDLLEIAKKAWERVGLSPKQFNCEQSVTIHGFNNYFTQIRVELQNENNAGNRSGSYHRPTEADKRNSQIIGSDEIRERIEAEMLTDALSDGPPE